MFIEILDNGGTIPLPSSDTGAATKLQNLISYIKQSDKRVLFSMDNEACGFRNVRQIGISVWLDDELLMTFCSSVVSHNYSCMYQFDYNYDEHVKDGPRTLKEFWNKTPEMQQKYQQINLYSRGRENIVAALREYFAPIIALRKTHDCRLGGRPIAYDFELLNSLYDDIEDSSPFGFGGGSQVLDFGQHLAALVNPTTCQPIDFGLLLKNNPAVNRELMHDALQDSIDQYTTYRWALESIPRTKAVLSGAYCTFDLGKS
jgi:hypothetical protein